MMSTWCSHSADMMKYSSTETAPKGRMPPSMQDTTGCRYHCCCGIARGIWLVRTGKVTTSL